ncbi:MAG: hypothetical protein PHY79_24940 [Anaerolineae bacterium]|nr:hypothetical protein [Anaerolineae bacterium]
MALATGWARLALTARHQLGRRRRATAAACLPLVDLRRSSGLTRSHITVGGAM